MAISVDVADLSDDELRECLEEAKRRGMTVGESVQEAFRRNLLLAYEQIGAGDIGRGVALIEYMLQPGGMGKASIAPRFRQTGVAA